MTHQRLISAIRIGSAAAVSMAALAALSGCEERPYPAPSHSAPPPPPPAASLMGAPDHGSPYMAPPVYQQPAYTPPPAYAPPPVYAPAPAYSSPYDTGSVVAMAPIPNPGDPGSRDYYDGRYRDESRYHGAGRVHAHYDNSAPMVAENTVTSPYGEGHPAPGHRAMYAAPAPMAPPVYAKASPPAYVPPVKPTPPAYVAPRAPVYAKSTTTTTTHTMTTAKVYGPTLPPVAAYDAKKIEHKGAAVAAAAGAAAGVVAMDAKHAVKTAVNTYKAKTAAPATPAPMPMPAAGGDRATRLASLQTVLTDAVGKTAVLTAPSTFTANHPADVSLTLPAGFGDTMHSEAQKDGLGDAAASVDMTAMLSGDGFAVTPDDTQSAQLTAGQPTEFHWTVTAQPGAKGPLHADIGADLLGGGSDKLALGSVQKAAGMGIKLTPHVIGASLLVLIAALVVAWLARGRGPTRSVAARRASRRAARGGRPLDMSAPTTTEETVVP